MVCDVGPFDETGWLQGCQRRKRFDKIAQGSGQTAFGWRAAVDELRPFTQDLWRAANATERARSLRHLEHGAVSQCRCQLPCGDKVDGGKLGQVWRFCIADGVRKVSDNEDLSSLLGMQGGAHLRARPEIVVENDVRAA